MAKNKKNEIKIRSSAAEYLTYIAATGDSEQSGLLAGTDKFPYAFHI
ncbi:MAG: hypothetical protein LBH17_01150 [Oscillospiraceae bacterium]|jgi:hypothetical protein|nr:hypothetical protein [Oscillospiraceae bacterium]